MECVAKTPIAVGSMNAVSSDEESMDPKEVGTWPPFVAPNSSPSPSSLKEMGAFGESEDAGIIDGAGSTGAGGLTSFLALAFFAATSALGISLAGDAPDCGLVTAEMLGFARDLTAPPSAFEGLEVGDGEGTCEGVTEAVLFVALPSVTVVSGDVTTKAPDSSPSPVSPSSLWEVEAAEACTLESSLVVAGVAV